MRQIWLAGLLLAVTACTGPGYGTSRSYSDGSGLTPMQRAQISAIRSNDRLDELQKRRLIQRVLAGE